MSTCAWDTSPGPLDDAPGSLLHAAHEGIVTIDESQRIVMINPAAQRMFGCAAGEALGSDLSRFIPARLRVAHREHVRRFDASGVPERSMGERQLVTGLRADGEEFSAAVTITRVDGGGPFASNRFFTALVLDLHAPLELVLATATWDVRIEALLASPAFVTAARAGDHV